MEQPDFKAIAAQLRNPDGAEGIKTAVRMSENNAFMITSTIDSLPVQPGDRLFELGPGGGKHLSYLFEQYPDVLYTGADISETMIGMATQHNRALVEGSCVSMVAVQPENGCCFLPFPGHHFDHIFTVNTLYFWDNAPAQAKELLRVLKPGGTLAVCFAPEDFMKTLPFTQYGFRLYTEEHATRLLEDAGFKNVRPEQHSEWIDNTVNGRIERHFLILTATR